MLWPESGSEVDVVQPSQGIERVCQIPSDGGGVCEQGNAFSMQRLPQFRVFKETIDAEFDH